MNLNKPLNKRRAHKINKFSSFDFPIRGHYKQYFKITNENESEVPYIGKYALIAQTRDMWCIIKSGESQNFSVELYPEYDFSLTPGEYTIEFISPEAMKMILEQPDKSSGKGRRDLTLLSVLYDTGARVQELIDIKICDIILNSPPVIIQLLLNSL